MITVMICGIVVAGIGAFSEWRVYKQSLKQREIIKKYNDLVDKYNQLRNYSYEALLDFEALYQGLSTVYTEEEIEDLIFAYREDNEL